MKRIALLLALLLASLTVKAQFTVSPQGIINETGKDYVVYEFEGKTQQELFTATNVALHAMYVSPKDVLSIVENNSITINGVNPDIWRDRNMMSTVPSLTMNYTIVVEFKDGRIRIMNPTINRLIVPVSGTETTSYNGSEYLGYLFKNDKAKHPKTNASIESSLNSLVNKIMSSITDQKKEEW